MTLEWQLQQWIAELFWPFVRVAAMLMAAPIFSVRQVFTRYRIMLAVLIAWLVSPVLPAAQSVEILSAAGLMLILQQVAIGVIMGFMLQLAFNALIFGGQVMAYSMGLGFANMMDPTSGVNVPMISQFWLIMAMLAFLLSNGHLMLLEAIVNSFHILPVAVDGVTRNGLWEIVVWSSRMFAAGLLMAMPIVIALLFVNIGLGVISRAAPQLNIFAIGFPISILVGFLLIWISLPQVMAGFGAFANEAFETTGQVLGAR